MNDISRPTAPADQATPELRPRWRRVLADHPVLVIALAVCVLALAAWLSGHHAVRSPAGRFGAGGPVPVVTAEVRTGDMPVTLIGLGAVTPLATVTVQSQIAGQIMRISFREGQKVKAGDPLFLIDPRPYEVALAQAQGTLERDQALLANARTDLERYQTLWSQDSIAEQQLTTQKSLVVQYEGNVRTDRAQIDAARLNIAYCHIVSPISGRIGLQQVNVGNYVTPSEPNGLAVIAQMQPMTVVFTISEDDIPALLAQLHAGRTLTATARDRTDTHVLATGTLEAVDSTIDPTTGTLRLKARFDNADEALFPQQFVNVVLLLDTLHGVTVVPQAAIQRGAPGTFVYVVSADHRVSVRPVTLGPGDPASVVIRSGLRPGESIVVDGADRLKEGAQVVLRSAAAAGTAPAAASPGMQGRGDATHRRPARGAPGGG